MIYNTDTVSIRMCSILVVYICRHNLFKQNLNNKSSDINWWLVRVTLSGCLVAFCSKILESVMGTYK